MRSLLDINVLIALFDPNHAFHSRAHQWWARSADEGWASCPLTENGMVRVMSNPGYSRVSQFSPGHLIEGLSAFVAATNHEFWPGDISLRNREIFAGERIHGSRIITDLYLLALATKHQGRLATFDQGIPLSAVHAASRARLCVI